MQILVSMTIFPLVHGSLPLTLLIFKLKISDSPLLACHCHHITAARAFFRVLVSLWCFLMLVKWLLWINNIIINNNVVIFPRLFTIVSSNSVSFSSHKIYIIKESDVNFHCYIAILMALKLNVSLVNNETIFQTIRICFIVSKRIIHVFTKLQSFIAYLVHTKNQC